MIGALPLLLLVAGLALGQVTLVSPEEGKRALENLPPAPASQKAGAKPAPIPRPRRGSMLPDRFAGWVSADTERFGPYNAATIAGKDAPVLVEYGYRGAERTTYRRNEQTLTVGAIRLQDSSGSYGLYTFYRGEDWETRDLGEEQIAARGGDLLIHKQEILVRASLSDPGARLSPDEVRELRAELEVNGGGPVPTLPRYLPEKGLLPKTRKYLLGPEALARAAPDLPTALVDFQMGAEAELARYRLPGKPPMTLLLVNYPTPQIAAVKLKTWQQLPSPGADPITTLLYARRSGPIVAFAKAADKRDAKDLLEAISYSAQITWNERVEGDDAPTWARFLINLFVLIGTLLGFALLAGLGFGLLRVVLQRRYPNRFFDRLEETEIIQLHINYTK